MKIGGFLMWPIFALLVVSLGVILEKIYQIIKTHTDQQTIKSLYSKIANGDLQNLENFCKSHPKLLCITCLEIINSSKCNISAKEYELLLEYTASSKISNLEKGSWILGVCVAAAPQLGLLGTVTGMIKSFDALSATIAQEVAVGISQALYTTAFGLLVAIPILMCHVVINKYIEIQAKNLDSLCLFLLNDFNKRVKNEIC